MATYQIATNTAATSGNGHAFVPAVTDLTKFKLLSSNEKETELVSVASPLGLSDRVKTGVRSIQNVYSGTRIDPGLYPPVKSGVSVVFQKNETWTMSDPNDASVPTFALPVEAHTVIRLPNNSLISLDDVIGLLQRMMGIVLDANAERLAALVRGSHRFG